MQQGAHGEAAATADVIREARAQQGGRVPVLAALPGGDQLTPESAAACVEGGADGVALHYDRLHQAAACFSGRTLEASASMVGGPRPHVFVPERSGLQGCSQDTAIHAGNMQTRRIFRASQTSA